MVMRINSLLATVAMAVAVLFALPRVHAAPQPVPATPEISLCIFPMAAAAASESCVDHTPSSPGGEDQLAPD